MTGKGVTIDIGNTPVKHGVQKEHDNKYYYDDEHRERAEMTLVEHPSEAPGYKKLEHKPKGNNAKILRIDNVGGTRTEFNNDLDDCKIVIVYYWSGDGDYTDPLVVQLSGEKDKYYTDTGSKWTNADIKSDDLLKTLDEQNCLLFQQKITLNSSPVDNKYTKVSHDLSSNFVGRLKNDHQDISGISITGNINTVTVYWYPLTGGSPLLIYFSSYSAWIKRVSKKTNYWTPAEEDELNGEDDPKILPLLKSINGDKEGHSAGAISSGVFGTSFGGYSLFETYALIFNKRLSLILKLVTRLITRV